MVEQLVGINHFENVRVRKFVRGTEVVGKMNCIDGLHCPAERNHNLKTRASISGGAITKIF
jgi:hypothetical protein